MALLGSLFGLAIGLVLMWLVAPATPEPLGTFVYVSGTVGATVFTILSIAALLRLVTRRKF